jgi:hypothetical protein
MTIDVDYTEEMIRIRGAGRDITHKFKTEPMTSGGGSLMLSDKVYDELGRKLSVFFKDGRTWSVTVNAIEDGEVNTEFEQQAEVSRVDDLLGILEIASEQYYLDLSKRQEEEMDYDEYDDYLELMKLMQGRL